MAEQDQIDVVNSFNSYAGALLSAGQIGVRNFPTVSGVLGRTGLVFGVTGEAVEVIIADPGDDRNRELHGAAGNISGTTVGGVVGTLVGGPVGGIIGGLIGSSIGEAVGEGLHDWEPRLSNNHTFEEVYTTSDGNIGRVNIVTISGVPHHVTEIFDKDTGLVAQMA